MKTRGVPDFVLLILTALLLGIGVTMVLSASSIYAYTGVYTSRGCGICNGDELFFVKKQIMWAVLGIIAMLVAMNIPFSFYKRNFRWIVVGSFVLLLLVLAVGSEGKGAQSWFKLGGASIQPAEIAKLGIILYLAAIIDKKGDRFRQFKSGLIPPLVVTGIFFVLIAIQPDLGSAAVLLGTAALVMICGGARISHLFMLTVPIGSLFLASYVTLYSHALSRLTTFMDPWSDPMGAGWQLKQSLFALAHGGLSGVGFGKSVQKYLYLPEAHTDFIFSIIAEELGFIGTVLFLLLYILFLLRGLQICLRCKDTFATLVGVGIVSMIGLQALINIGGVTGALPLTGVTLPFISYGGSSLLITLVSTGILLSVSREVSKQKAAANA
ncbi:putative lipid II flippase FtsW [Brevibacillus migulae]|uniref:putative lipid II flippase FtsW n=1 Tax=Brevibacillus migulae TaxID=1644114 RepID=UPI00106E3C2A|nr:putative lipid II flippase FtsW [Brevibacillus migulae]